MILNHSSIFNREKGLVIESVRILCVSFYSNSIASLSLPHVLHSPPFHSIKTVVKLIVFLHYPAIGHVIYTNTNLIKSHLAVYKPLRWLQSLRQLDIILYFVHVIWSNSHPAPISFSVVLLLLVNPSHSLLSYFFN